MTMKPWHYPITYAQISAYNGRLVPPGFLELLHSLVSLSILLLVLGMTLVGWSMTYH
jgi:hypothetical protein